VTLTGSIRVVSVTLTMNNNMGTTTVSPLVLSR
jgi:hypothetical protein